MKGMEDMEGMKGMKGMRLVCQILCPGHESLVLAKDVSLRAVPVVSWALEPW